MVERGGGGEEGADAGRKIKLNCPIRESAYFVARSERNPGLICIHGGRVDSTYSIRAPLLENCARSFDFSTRQIYQSNFAFV